MTYLSKRTAGTPLSEAELQQRKDAARARWAAAGAAGAAAVAGAAAGIAVSRKIVARNQGIWSGVRQAHEGTVRAEDARSAARYEQLKNREAAGYKRVSRGWPVPLYRVVKENDAKKEERAARRLPGEVFDLGEQGRVVVPYDQDTLHSHLNAASLHRGEAASLEDGYPPKTVKRKMTIAKAPKPHDRKLKYKKIPPPKVEPPWKETERVLMGHQEMLMEATIAGAPDHELAQYELEGKLLRQKLEGQKTQHKRAVALIRRARKENPRSVPVKGGKGAVDDNPKRVVRIAATERRQGVPKDKELRRIRNIMHDRVSTHIGDARFRETVKHHGLAQDASALFRSKASHLLENRISRRGRLGIAVTAGLAAGGLVGYGTYKAATITKIAHAAGLLAKAASEAYEDDPSDALLDIGTSAEDEMASRLARVFRSWKDAAEDMMTPGNASLLDRIKESLSGAMSPLAEAYRGGGDTPALASSSGRGPDPSLTFTFRSRSPFPQAYVERYRQSKIVQLANEQEVNIRGILSLGARSGMSPNEMALRIRQSIGLTEQQAAAVQAYRRELQGLDGAALNRALRDKRYDSPIQRAVEKQEPLTEAQVDRMVDAYHRKYLAYRAMTIARTEGVGAANNGHMAQVQDTIDDHPNMDIEKTWIATMDGKTRPDHVKLHGTTVTGFNATFTTESGDELRWPHDPNAPARQVCNCRCTIRTILVPRGRTFAARMPMEAS